MKAQRSCAGSAAPSELCEGREDEALNVMVCASVLAMAESSIANEEMRTLLQQDLPNHLVSMT